MIDIIKPTKEQVDQAGLVLCKARGLDPSAALDGDWGRSVTNLDWYRSEAYSALVVMLNSDRLRKDEFKPCAIEYKEGHHTEIVLADCLTIWHPWDCEGIDLGYNEQGALVAIRVPGLVAKATRDET
jgi:hypothetical protein